LARQAAVVDSFYPGDAKRLAKDVERYIDEAKVDSDDARKMLCYVAPHAGYQYSGSVAGYTYKAISERGDKDSIDTFIIVGPNHTGRGAPIALSGDDWKTPLGQVGNDIELTRAIVASSKGAAEIDEHAHASEHSVEVQLPFLQSVVTSPRCVFICMGDQSYDSAVKLSDAISKAVGSLKRKVIMIASSDFNHYEPFVLAKTKDLEQINPMVEMDAKRFDYMLGKSGSSICGHGPIAATMLFSQTLGAKKGMLLHYANSGDVNNDYTSVVTYASVAFLR
jgi:MEMO1 family protein